jgi:4,5-dihydroxyphthalate decarboxylase
VLKLDFASIYYPYFGKLLDGSYSSHEIELVWHYASPPDKLFRQVIESAPYDVSEMSLSGYTMLRDQGWKEYIGLPIFTSRRFRHSALYVRRESPIVSGEQLAGKRVGLPEYHMTAAVWVRGILEEDFGVKPQDIEWYTGGAEHPGRVERVTLPREVAARIHPIGQSETLFNMLLSGRLDAVMCAHKPQIAGKNGPVRSLFPDPRAAEKKYYLKHAIFPVMHTLILKSVHAREGRDIALRIHRTLEELKKDFYEKVAILQKSPVFPWLDDYIEEITEMMGEDPWGHGIVKNTRPLNKFLDYSYSHGLIKKRPELEELFIDLEE